MGDIYVEKKPKRENEIMHTALDKMFPMPWKWRPDAPVGTADDDPEVEGSAFDKGDAEPRTAEEAVNASKKLLR